MLGELETRFDSLNISLIKSMQALAPNSKCFLDFDTLLPFLCHYDISSDEIQNELLLAKEMLSSSPASTDLNSLHDVYSRLAPVSTGYPTLLPAIQIAMTMGVTSASAERSFSSLRRVKTYLRSTMTEDRLNNLALLNIERELSSLSSIDMDNVIDAFASKHKNARITLV